MKRLAAALLVLVPAAGLATDEHFNVSAAYVQPAKPGAPGAVAVAFVSADPDVRINQEPAPRFKLDPGQTVLIDRQPAAAARKGERAGEPKYLDTTLPVNFLVSLNPKAPKGEQMVKATVTYFYCSKTEGWCRKGTADVEVPVSVR
jgi:hypothetical protein